MSFRSIVGVSIMLLTALLVALLFDNSRPMKVELLSSRDMQKVYGGSCFIPGVESCPEINNTCTSTSCNFDPDNPPPNGVHCTREEEVLQNEEDYSKALADFGGLCDENSAAFNINCHVRYYCDTDCEPDELGWVWSCISTGILSSYSAPRTPTYPGGNACPDCYFVNIPLDVVPIAKINGIAIH